MREGPPPDSFTSFTSGVNGEVNEIIAGRHSDSYARSPRSLRCERGSPHARPLACARTLPYLQNEVNEVNEKGVPPSRVRIFSFTSGLMGEVNEVNEVGACV